MVQTASFATLLQTDPDFGISYIIENNTPAVAQNLRSAGYSVSNERDIFEALNDIRAKGADDVFVAVLSVPYLTEGIDPAQTTILYQVASGMARAHTQGGIGRRARNAGTAKSGVPSDIPDIPEVQDQEVIDDTQPANGGSNATDWANAFGNLAVGILGLLNSHGQDGPLQPVNTQAAAANAGADAQKAAAKRQTWMIVGISAAVLVAIAVIIIIAKSKKAKK